MCVKGHIRLRKASHRHGMDEGMTTSPHNVHNCKADTDPKCSITPRLKVYRLYYVQDPNPNIPSGKVEMIAEDVIMLNAISGGLPLSISEDPKAEEPKEETRLKNRVLDLRYDLISDMQSHTGACSHGQ